MKRTILCTLIILSGCSFTTLQIPRTAEPGEFFFGGGGGVGFANTDDGVGPIFETTVNMRIGLFKRFDIGFKYVVPVGFTADAKIQLLSNPDLSLSLGGSYIPEINIELDPGAFVTEKRQYTTAVYPVLLFGSERLFIGIKYNIWYEHYEGVSWYYTGTRTYKTRLPGFLIGTSFGSSRKIIVELNAYWVEEEQENLSGFAVVLGIGGFVGTGNK